MDKNKYKLLTPGPLTTTETVKEEMLVDLCTWDDDYKQMTQEIRAELLRLAHAETGYTTVLMQGSGTFGVEAVLSSVIKDTDKLLIAVNGAYSKRMAEICRYHRIPYGTVEYNNLNKYPGMIEKIRQAKYEVLYCKLNKDMDEVVIDNIEDAAYIKVVF